MLTVTEQILLTIKNSSEMLIDVNTLVKIDILLPSYNRYIIDILLLEN